MTKPLAAPLSQPVAWLYRSYLNIGGPRDSWAVSELRVTVDLEATKKHPSGGEWPLTDVQPVYLHPEVAAPLPEPTEEATAFNEGVMAAYERIEKDGADEDGCLELADTLERIKLQCKPLFPLPEIASEPKAPKEDRIQAMAVCDTSAALSADAPEITMSDVGTLARAYLHLRRTIHTPVPLGEPASEPKCIHCLQIRELHTKRGWCLQGEHKFQLALSSAPIDQSFEGE